MHDAGLTDSEARRRVTPCSPTPSLLVIEMLGRAGVGKSTVSRAACAMLRETLPLYAVESVGRENRLVRELSWCMRRPSLIALAWRLSRITLKQNPWYWLRRLARRDRRSATQRWARRPTILVEDMGLLHFLNKAKAPLSSRILPRLPLPDIVIVLKASLCDSAWRRVKRPKRSFPIQPREGMTGRAVMMARHFLQERGEEETLRFLDAWNRQSGALQLSQKALRGCFETARAMPPPAPVPDSKTYHFKAALTARGVLWFEVDSSDGREVTDIARDVVGIISSVAAGNRDLGEAEPSGRDPGRVHVSA